MGCGPVGGNGIIVRVLQIHSSGGTKHKLSDTQQWGHQTQTVRYAAVGAPNTNCQIRSSGGTRHKLSDTQQWGHQTQTVRYTAVGAPNTNCYVELDVRLKLSLPQLDLGI